MDLPEAPRRGAARFWPDRCGSFSKELLLLVLLCGFLVQTLLVYTDVHDTVPLGEQAIHGRKLWHQNNCQSCHQFHGFGGFLGPDLTNASVRLDRALLASRLELGADQMPTYTLDDVEIDALWEFLVAMNETGQGQARNPNLIGLASAAGGAGFGAGGDGSAVESSGEASGEASGEEGSASAEVSLDASVAGKPASEPPTTPGAALHLVAAESGSQEVIEGMALFQERNCLSCHVYFARSAIGAPDLSLSGRALADDQIEAMLANGIPPRMPQPVLSAAERLKVRLFIRFMADSRNEALSRVVEEPGSFWGSLPWWEYQ